MCLVDRCTVGRIRRRGPHQRVVNLSWLKIVIWGGTVVMKMKDSAITVKVLSLSHDTYKDDTHFKIPRSMNFVVVCSSSSKKYYFFYNINYYYRKRSEREGVVYTNNIISINNSY